MTPGGPPLIEVSAVTVRRQRELLLDQISISVAPLTLHAIVGPNGAGKSTLLSAILGLCAFEGKIIANWRGQGAIGYVPQNFSVDPTLPVTVEDFLALTRQRRPICLGINKASRRVISTLLETAGLSGLEPRQLSVLSGGEMRRLLLAHAMNPLPELLILDEPSSGLDASSISHLESILTDLKGRTTVLLVSHDFEQVRRIADRVTILDCWVIADGPPEEIFANHKAALLGSGRQGFAPC